MLSAHLAPPSSSKLSISPSSSSSGHPHHHHHHSTNTSSSSHHSHTHNIPTAPLVEPPSLFASVVPQIYRSATPTPANHSFLRTLQLKTILSLTAELPSPSLTAFCKKHGIRFLHFGLKRWGTEDSLSAPSPHSTSHQHSGTTNDDQDNLTHLDLSFLHSITPTSTHTNNTSYNPAFSSSSPTLTEELVKDSLQILLDSSYHPVLVTDTSGIHEIGVLLGCLRKLQRWNFATILLEYRQFAGNRARATNERFVEMFDTDLISCPDEAAPEWFKEQVREDDAELDRVESSCT
ncbi:related to OCA1 - putative protein tyrosine phosphatase [Ustilago trichophora]|uniref:Uncharacterized protein n=1 Tax=Ustilago trichophora TaxID=86804 RepID=A0A5C3EL48_9BASI|nr:related to OCA1 - putative protein tyrosine phosphatase [Ustilago trichophora]